MAKLKVAIDQRGRSLSIPFFPPITIGAGDIKDLRGEPDKFNEAIATGAVMNFDLSSSQDGLGRVWVVTSNVDFRFKTIVATAASGTCAETENGVIFWPALVPLYVETLGTKGADSMNVYFEAQSLTADGRISGLRIDIVQPSVT